ncbi:MAG: hypothetical protein LUD81_07520 [Clostridiales bacterium]|nr:hypothetical protein [Clostridiales bacterium]
MTLLITTFAAVITAVVWYCTDFDNSKRFVTLCLMYTGAALMWFVDAVVEYVEFGADYFTPAAADMLNDSYLGFSVVALGLVIWFAVLCIKGPEDKIKNAFRRS